jgi:integrase
MTSKAQHILTALQVKHIVNAAKPIQISDGAGLTLTVSKSGYAAWVLRYRFGGKRKELTIGSYQDYSLKLAREVASEFRRQVETSIDPSKEKKVRKAADKAGELPQTFSELAELWYVKRKLNNLQHPHIIKRVVDKWIYPKLGKLYLDRITAAQVVRCIENVIDSGAPTVANDVRRHIKEILKYGTILGCMQFNVAADLSQQDAGTKEKSRNRYLTVDEITLLTSSIAKNRDWFGRDNELTIYLLLLLGVRKSELIKAKWEQFDLENGLWAIPDDTKTKTAYIVPLPECVVEYFQEIKVRACGSEWVFPARRRGVRKLGHISTDTINAALANLDVDIEHFTIHDLRRTMRTQLAALGIRTEVAERCLNHKLKGVVDIYDRHDYLDDRRKALSLWADTFQNKIEVNKLELTK